MGNTAALVASQRWWGGYAVQGPLAAAAPSGVPATIQASIQDVWPPRVLLTAQGLNLGHTVTIWRSVGGVRTAVRGAADITTADVALVVLDAEEPFGVMIVYVLSVDGVDVDSTTITVPLPGGNVALSDAVSGLAAEVVITAWPDKNRSRPSSAFTVAGRNIVVTGDRGGFASTVELFTMTTSAAESLEALLDGATSATIQIRQPGGYDRVDCYVCVTGDDEKRFSQDGTDERRLWTLEVLEVTAWAPILTVAGFTYADVNAVYAGLTYQQLLDDYGSYLAVLQGDFS